MADISDVLNAIAAAVDAAVYPSGDGNPSAIVVGGSPVITKIYTGWPVSANLDADLAANLVNITVFAPNGMERNVTRYPRDWKVTSVPAKTITTTLNPAGTMVTFGGTISTPQNVAIIANDVAVAYQVQAGDTLSTVAAAMAALLVAQGIAATATGPAVTIANAHALIGRVGAVGTAQMEVKRQNRIFQISLWCPGGTPENGGVAAYRTAAAKIVDPVLASANFLTLADGSTGRLLYQKTWLDDGIQKAGCYREDLFYSVEYGTNIEQAAAEAIVITTTIQGATPAFSAFTDTDPPPLVVNA